MEDVVINKVVKHGYVPNLGVHFKVSLNFYSSHHLSLKSDHVT